MCPYFGVDAVRTQNGGRVMRRYQRAQGIIQRLFGWGGGGGSTEDEMVAKGWKEHAWLSFHGR